MSSSNPIDGSFARFGASTYGDAFADVYDDWYADISDIDATVELLLGLADGGPILELGVGTGRIAIPLARAARSTGSKVAGIDISARMLAVLRERDTEGVVEVVEGDMVSELPTGPFATVAIPYNTIFNITDAEAQARLFREVAQRLVPGGRFVVEAFVPSDPPPSGNSIDVRSMTADQVVLSVSQYDARRQRADGQFVEFTEEHGVRLRPWSIRYLTTAQLDRLAGAAGLDLEYRWESVDRSPFTTNSERHVSVYRHDP